MTKKIVIICDSFKGSASSLEVGSAIKKGILDLDDTCEVSAFPIADGGEGTVDTIISLLNGERIRLTSMGPMGNSISSYYGCAKDAAYIEVAQSAGLTLVEGELNPRRATSFGVGEQIKAAIEKGYRQIYIGLGGSATNDCGVGLARALGYRFMDVNNKIIKDDVLTFDTIDRIEDTDVDPILKDVTITILSDVQNPLCGKNGATAIYGPQKGIKTEDIDLFDDKLRHVGNVLETYSSKRILDQSGSGAAGGIGAALLALTNATIEPGVEAIIKLSNLDFEIQSADLVITGEGRIDGQTFNGKVPVGVSKCAKMYNKPVIAIVGSQSRDAYKLYDLGIDLILDTVNEPMTLETAMNDVESLLMNAARQAYYAWKMIDRYQ